MQEDTGDLGTVAGLLYNHAWNDKFRFRVSVCHLVSRFFYIYITRFYGETKVKITKHKSQLSPEKVNRSESTNFSLTGWRETLVINILRGTSVLSLIALVPSGIQMVQRALLLQVALFLFAWILLLLVTFGNVSYKVRVFVLLTLVYAVSINVLLEAGLHGDTRLFFLAFIILTLMFLGLRAALLAFGLTLLTSIAIGWAMFNGTLTMTNPNAFNYPPLTWASDLAVMMLAVGFLATGISTLLQQFSLARQQVQQTLETLEQEHDQLEQRVHERTLELDALRETSLIIGSQLEIKELLSSIVEHGCQLLDVPVGALYLVDTENNLLELNVAFGLSQENTNLKLKPGEGLSGKIWLSGEPLIVEDYSHWENKSSQWNAHALTGTLGVPLEFNQQVIGVLSFGEIGKPRRFDDHDTWLAKLFANQASIAIHNARLFEKSQQEIAERKRAESALRKSQAQLLHDALHDSLTGLPNRSLLLDRLGRAMERLKRRKEYLFAVLFLDIDRFKVINDSLGHVVGDILLTAMARRLESCLRTADTVARLGGDEFVIFLEDINSINDATYVAARIHEELKLPFSIEGSSIIVSASIGIVLSTAGYKNPDEILRDADIALYRAKALGKARYELFDSKMRDKARARLDLESALRQAIDKQEFHLHYQPVVVLETNTIVGFEALVRWQHPTRGLISPDDFIPVADETGLIIPLGKWILQEACGQMHTWQSDFSLDDTTFISVNLSTKQFTDPDLVEQVKLVLRETGLDPSSLTLEITEGMLMADTEFAVKLLEKLGALGVRVQIDDFGLGYSSLYYLQHFPINTVKIDRYFIHRMKNDENGDVVRAIVSLARDLGMNAIAEGVETAEQLENLKDFKCRFGQGFYVSNPLDSKAATSLIKSIQQKI
jgi:diguanylate cyclase (GGDEF)-like protein